MQTIAADRYKRMEEWLLRPVGQSPETKDPIKAPELPPEKPKEKPKDFSKMTWADLKKAAAKKGVFKITMKKADVIKALQE